MLNDPSSARIRKILVVDDNSVIRKVVEMKLAAAGYIAAGAADASAAVTAVKKEKPDLILLDLLFPPDAQEVGMSWNGLGIMQWLHSVLSGATDIPIIIISGADPAKYRDACLKAGAAAYFRKPLNMDEIIVAIRTVLDRRSSVAA